MNSASLIWLVGIIAGMLTTLSFVPQVLRTWRSRSAGDLSMSMLVTFAVGVALWIAYGLVLAALPIVLWNLVTLVLALALIVMKVGFE